MKSIFSILPYFLVTNDKFFPFITENYTQIVRKHHKKREKCTPKYNLVFCLTFFRTKETILPFITEHFTQIVHGHHEKKDMYYQDISFCFPLLSSFYGEVGKGWTERVVGEDSSSTCLTGSHLCRSKFIE